MDKDRNSGVPGTIYLVIDIGWDSNVTKFHEDLIKTVWLREQTHLAAHLPVSSNLVKTSSASVSQTSFTVN